MAGDWQALEPLCSHITRPALANGRLHAHAAGRVVLKLKTAWRDGTAYVIMSPLKFMKQQIDGRLCGIEFCEGVVSSGSTAPCAQQD
jgi:Putative transposase